MRGQKITRFRDIPRFTRMGTWECDFEIDRLVLNLCGSWIKEQGLILNPDFQRGHVWTEKQQIAFVEFFLRGGRTARVIYLNKPSWHKKATTDYDDFVIVDGLQRLTAFRRFFDNEICVFGSYFREYTDKIRMSTNTVRVHVNDLQTRAEVLRWYLDFNRGGTPHSDSELRRVEKLLAKEMGQ